MANLILNKKGNTINLTDSTDNKAKSFALYGKATQEGAPTPDSPVEIEVAGASGSVEVKSVGKNLLENMATTQTVNGITFTVNEDGSVTANGTATAKAELAIQIQPNIADDVPLILSGCPSGGSLSTYRLQYANFSNSDGIIIDYGNGATITEQFDYTTYPNARIMIRIESGQTVNNLTFYPMIRLASDTDDTFEPYKESTITVPTPNGLCGIKVSSGGNYTDENGQQWIADEVVKYADGSGKDIQRIGVIDSYNGESITTQYMSTTGQLTNGAKVIYILPTPIITDLTAEEIAEIEKLHTFYPVTNISNDADCGMEISYVSTKQNMQVKALLSGVETTFTDLGNNVFEAVLTAPNHDGLYEIEINALSQTGDTTSATVDLTVASWVTPKVNWLPTDRLNIQDFNRIRNNMISLWELLQWEFGHFSIEDMGDELTEYTGRWNVNHFNAFEKNLEIFRTLLPIDDFGLTQTFYYNGMLIKYDELNRIENLLLRFKQYAASREAGIRKLPFRLGAFREVRI